jgi:signal transduction histidine kinase
LIEGIFEIGRLSMSENNSELNDFDVIEISVEDTGRGISPEDQQKLFQPFQQLDTSLTREYGGTGLGLNLCKKFVELHGGRIWVESEVGKGSRFVFRIPIRQ